MRFSAGMAPAAFVAMIAPIIFMSTTKFTYTAEFVACIDRVISQEKLSPLATFAWGYFWGYFHWTEIYIKLNEVLAL